MAGPDADFAAYVAARWPILVRTTVFAGASRAAAEEIVRDGLASCALSWDRMRRSDDVDVHVHGAVLACAHRRLRRAGEQPAEATREPATDDPVEEQVRRALVLALSRLVPEHREVLALRHVAGLDNARIADALDVDLDEVAGRANQAASDLDLTEVHELVRRDTRRAPPTTDEVFRMAAEAIEVLAAPYDAVLAGARDRRRRHVRRVVAAVVVAVVVVGGLTWWGTRPQPTPKDTAEPTVTRADNPADVSWYANGVLHLARVTVKLPQLTDLVEINGGAVYGDTDGVVGFVTADGTRRVLGHKDTTSPLVGSRDDGWVSWAASDGSGLVAYDLGRGASLPADPAGSRARPGVLPIAIDQGRVFYSVDGSTYAWDPRTGLVARDLRAGLADINAATRAYQVENSIDLVQPFFSVDYVRRGIGAELSSGGSYVLTRKPGDDDSFRGFTPLLYDVRSGRRLPSGLGAGEVALDATFGSTNTVDYLVGRSAELTGDPGLDGSVQPLLVVRSCQVAGQSAGQCTDVVPIQLRSGSALLAR